MIGAITPPAFKTKTPQPPSTRGLEGFYKTSCGKHLGVEVENNLNKSWNDQNLSHCHILCIGFPVPGIKALSQKGASFALFTPGFLGAKKMVRKGMNFSATGDEAHLPFRQGSYDRAYIFHALEYMEDQVSFLEELWKVLSPGGRIFLMVPNKKGPWKKFGLPKPEAAKEFLTRDIKSLLRGKGFAIAGCFGAAYGLPVDFFGTPLFSGLLKTLSGGGTGGFPGFLILEAQKTTGSARGIPVRTLRPVRAKPAAPIRG